MVMRLGKVVSIVNGQISILSGKMEMAISKEDYLRMTIPIFFPTLI